MSDKSELNSFRADVVSKAFENARKAFPKDYGVNSSPKIEELKNNAMKKPDSESTKNPEKHCAGAKTFVKRSAEEIVKNEKLADKNEEETLLATDSADVICNFNCHQDGEIFSNRCKRPDNKEGSENVKISNDRNENNNFIADDDDDRNSRKNSDESDVNESASCLSKIYQNDHDQEFTERFSNQEYPESRKTATKISKRSTDAKRPKTRNNCLKNYSKSSPIGFLPCDCSYCCENHKNFNPYKQICRFNDHHRRRWSHHYETYYSPCKCDYCNFCINYFPNYTCITHVILYCQCHGRKKHRSCCSSRRTTLRDSKTFENTHKSSVSPTNRHQSKSKNHRHSSSRSYEKNMEIQTDKIDICSRRDSGFLSNFYNEYDGDTENDQDLQRYSSDKIMGNDKIQVLLKNCRRNNKDRRNNP